MDQQVFNKRVFTEYVKSLKYGLKKSKLPHTESDIANALGMSIPEFQNGLEGNISSDQLQHAYEVSNSALMNAMPGWKEFKRKESENNPGQ